MALTFCALSPSSAQRKTLGEPTDVVDGPNALEFNRNAVDFVSSPHELQTTKYVMAARDDGLVREEKENRVVSREDTTELTEVEDVKHYGDFSDAVSLLKTLFSRSTNRRTVRMSKQLKRSEAISVHNYL